MVQIKHRLFYQKILLFYNPNQITYHKLIYYNSMLDDLYPIQLQHKYMV